MENASNMVQKYIKNKNICLRIITKIFKYEKKKGKCYIVSFIKIKLVL